MKVMLLAAGRGKRMRPLTDTTPKPMLKVLGKPLIQYHLENLVNAGVTEVVINHAYLGAQIEEFLGDGSQFGVHIEYSAETTALETGGGIFKALPLLGKAPFLVVNADVWTDYPLRNLFDQTPEYAHLVLTDNPEYHADGDFNFSSGQLLAVASSASSRLTFSGISVLNPQLFERYQPGVFGLAQVFRHAIERSMVTGEHYEGAWFDIGTPQRLNELEDYLRA